MSSGDLEEVALHKNLYIDWVNKGLREGLMLGSGLVRYLSAVVVRELRAVRVLRRLKLAGWEARSVSLVNDVLIALVASASSVAQVAP